MQDIVARIDARKVPNKGDKVFLRVRTGEAHLFHATTGRRLEV